MPRRPRAVVILTGSELVRGDRADANGAFLGRELTRLGLEPARILLVGDEPSELEAAIREALTADLCVLSGGLGPTHDDRTIELLARALGRELVLDTALRTEIEAVSRDVASRLRRPYADFAPGVDKQASLPRGALSLGLAGTAPAVLVEHDERLAVALPGPPSELRRLWPRVLESEAFRSVGERARPPDHVLLRLFGPSESAVARALAEAGGEGGGVEATVCAHDLEVRIDVFASDGGGARAAALTQALRARFPLEIFAEDEQPVAAIVLDLCRGRGLTLATAESCTGGMVASRLTDAAGASEAFVGSVVAYSDAVKQASLGVPEGLLQAHGAVSAEVAGAMAAGARVRLGADVAVAVTGIAGPGGATAEKPVGLVYFHVASPEGESALERLIPGDREAVRTRATAVALHLLRQHLAQSATDAYVRSG